MAADDSLPEILEVFEECQLNHLAHDRLCVKLKNIYDNTRFSVFADDFLELCRYSLVSAERSLYRERTIDFITKFALFCGKDSNEDGVLNTIHNRILLRLIIFCIKYNECPNPAVRFRCMQIIHKLLDGIGDNGILPGEIYTKLQDVLLRRVYDVKVSVRVEAIKAISRMQDPNDAQCSVVEAFMWLTRHDPTAEVRRAAAAAMVLTTRTLGHLLERCRDVADNVRRTAYKILADRSIIRPLSIAKRIRILQDGLSDRSEDVRKATKALILSWFNASNRDPILLLHRLDPECEAETCQKVLDNLFDILSLDELLKVVQNWAATYLTSDHVLKSDCLTPDSAFFWRALIQFTRKKEAEVNELLVNSSVVHHENEEVDDQNPVEQIAELIQPSVCIYVDFAKNIVDKFLQSAADQQKDVKVFDEECIVEQILIIGGLLDISEEYGRRRLLSVVHDWITSQQVSANLAPQLLKLYAILEPNVRRRVNNVIEMISELCEPTEPDEPLPAPPVTTSDGATINEDCVSNEENEPRAIQTAISKKKEINIRLKIASLEVRMNEINESLHNCVTRKEFERATELRDECKRLEAERSQLLHELHGTVLPAVTENTAPSDGEQKVSVTTNRSDNNSGTSVKRDVDGNSVGNGSKNYMQKEEEVEDDEAEEDAEPEDDDPIKRCSPVVLHKANRLAALLIQQSPTLWTLPASLRSLLDTLVCSSF
ncbi:unnamed protein product [Trichobilharzia szidati]|nr:unnamed protein product [Trichobilharzia szidati]